MNVTDLVFPVLCPYSNGETIFDQRKKVQQSIPRSLFRFQVLQTQTLLCRSRIFTSSQPLRCRCTTNWTRGPRFTMKSWSNVPGCEACKTSVDAASKLRVFDLAEFVAGSLRISPAR